MTMKSQMNAVYEEVAIAHGPQARPIRDTRFDLEELEKLIAPGYRWNHNETFHPPQIVLQADELEPVIAPGFRLPNHNETLLQDPVKLKSGELEIVIAPGLRMNPNETGHTLVDWPAEELERVIAPGRVWNHNETVFTKPVVLEAEELETAVVAPLSGNPNHHESMVTPQLELTTTELESVIAPGIRIWNHNETFISATPVFPGGLRLNRWPPNESKEERKWNPN
jgi:hypothetical protein